MGNPRQQAAAPPEARSLAHSLRSLSLSLSLRHRLDAASVTATLLRAAAKSGRRRRKGRSNPRRNELIRFFKLQFANRNRLKISSAAHSAHSPLSLFPVGNSVAAPGKLSAMRLFQSSQASGADGTRTCPAQNGHGTRLTYRDCKTIDSS